TDWLRIGVIESMLLVVNRQGGRDASVVAQLSEVPLPQPKQRRTVKLGVTADVVVGVGVEIVPGRVAPHFLGAVPALEDHGARVPVLLLPRHVFAALAEQAARPGGREP